MARNQRGTCVKQKGQCGLLRAKWNNFISGGVEQPQITALVLSRPFCDFSLPGHCHWEPLPSPAPWWGPCSSALCRAQCWAAALQTPEHLRRGNEWFFCLLLPCAEPRAGQWHFRPRSTSGGEMSDFCLLLPSASWEPAGKTDWEAFHSPKCSNSETNVFSILIQPCSELWSACAPLFLPVSPQHCTLWWLLPLLGRLICFSFFSEAYWFVSSLQLKIKYVCPVCFLSS